MSTSSKNDSSEKYLNQTLLDGLRVLEFFLTDLSPFVFYSIQEIADKLGFEYGKTMRTVKTLQHVGYLRESDRGYLIGDKILSLPLRYITALKREHERIKDLVLNFNIDPTPLETSKNEPVELPGRLETQSNSLAPYEPPAWLSTDPDQIEIAPTF